jgi:hypothetical protein
MSPGKNHCCAGDRPIGGGRKNRHEQRGDVEYLPEFKGTHWDGIKMIDAANMATALTTGRNDEAIVDPTSIIVKFFSAEFGSPNPSTGKVDDWLEILKGAEKIEGEDPGYRFRYSSAVTQIFVVIAERIENKTWAEIFEERVWGNMTARGPMLHNLTPDGTSVAHGLLHNCRRFCTIWHVIHAELG